MDQQVRFCTTADGVRIAYADTGEGMPLVRVLGWFTHLEFEWENSPWGYLWRELSTHHRLVRYDGRGMGLSDRDVTDFSLESKVRDLEAVIDALKLRHSALLGVSEGGPAAIAYAVRHPQRVSHLVLYGSFSHMDSRPRSVEARDTMRAFIRLGWGSNNPMYRQFFTDMFIPESDAKRIRLLTELLRVSATPTTAAALFSELGFVDVRNLVPRLKMPTLVIHRKGDRAVPFRWGRELAASIPGARFLSLEGVNHPPISGEPEAEQMLAAIEQFLAEEPKSLRPGALKAPVVNTTPTTIGPLTILFTDMEGSTALTERLGDLPARELIRVHERITRAALKTHGGTEIKTLGDGFMASFALASSALEYAIALQQAITAHNERAATPIRVRIGLNAGEPIAEDTDLFGTAVNLAARVAARAEGGQILATDVVRQLVAGKGFLFADHGDVALRGFEDPVRLYEVHARQTA